MSEPFRSLVLNRRFGDETLRVLESILVPKDVKSSMELRSALSQFMRSESLSILRGIAEKNVEEKLLVLEFLVRTFALVGDVESCLALRYEALLLRDLKSTTHEWLKVPHLEWLKFAQQLLDNGFYSIAAKACENALLSLKGKSAEQSTPDGVPLGRSTEDPKTDEAFETEQVIQKIKKLKECAMASASSHSAKIQSCSRHRNTDGIQLARFLGPKDKKKAAANSYITTNYQSGRAAFTHSSFTPQYFHGIGNPTPLCSSKLKYQKTEVHP